MDITDAPIAMSMLCLCGDVTSVSDAARASLVSKGFTVVVNYP